MNRYFYYIVFINSLNSLIAFLPRILMDDRNNGAIMAIVFALPYGTLLLYFFSKAIMKFPNKGLPEIVKMTLPRWAQIMIILLFAPAWYLSGFSMLSALIDITIAFVNPDIPIILAIGIFLVLILYAVCMEGSTVLYALEIFMICIIPAVIFIFLKAVFNPFFSWDACMEVTTHSFSFPTLKSFGVTTYVFTGYMDMVTLNRAFKGKFQLKYVWLFPVIELILLLFVFFIPIGIQGTQGCGIYNYPWIVTADSLSIQTGPIERTLFIYLLVFLVTALVNIIVHWHVSLELFKGLFEYQLNFKRKKNVTWWIPISFSISPFIAKYFMTEQSTFTFVQKWLTFRVFVEPCFVGIIVMIAYIAKKKGLIR